MTRLPLASRVYVCSVIVLGTVAIATAIASVQFPRPGLFAALLVLSVISSAVKVDLPIGVGTSCISLSYAVDFTALLLLGPAPTMLIAVPSVLAQCTLRMNQRNPAYKTLFSMATVVISVAAAGATYTWFGGTYGTMPGAPLQPLMAAAMMHFAVNSSAVAAAVAFTTRSNVFRVWHDTFLWSISSYVVGAIGAGIAIEMLQQRRPVADDARVRSSWAHLSHLSHLPPTYCRRAAAGSRVVAASSR